MPTSTWAWHPAKGNMIEVNDAIARLRRDLTVGSLIKGAVLGAALFCLLLDALARPKGFSGAVALAVIGGVWLVLSYSSVRGSRMAAVSPALIASGNFEQAEQHIDEALRAFSLFRTVKLRSLHHLAVLRHAQRRGMETGVFCQALLRRGLGALGGFCWWTMVVLAGCLVRGGGWETGAR